jgi:hypothetical protein
MITEHKVEKVSIEKHIFHLNDSDIRGLLRTTFPDLHIPHNALVEFEVPRGGDYSGIKIDIDVANPIIVSFETRTNNDD